ncbi:MAG: AraC family ligand binding domain-containing protein, partial [Pseudonocardiaceae bacterium]
MSGEVPSPDGYVPGINVYVERLPLPGGSRFETHAHREHQVVWTTSSSILVAVGERTWVLPPTLALWVPAGVEHTTSAPRAAAMRGVYVHPQIPARWSEPTVVAMTAVVRELIDLLSDVELLGPTRERAESLLLDLLRPVYVQAITLPMPVDPRALEVARHLEEHPSESLGIERWGRKVGA